MYKFQKVLINPGIIIQTIKYMEVHIEKYIDVHIE
eukprot:UN02404